MLGAPKKPFVAVEHVQIEQETFHEPDGIAATDSGKSQRKTQSAVKSVQDPDARPMLEVEATHEPAFTCHAVGRLQAGAPFPIGAPVCDRLTTSGFKVRMRDSEIVESIREPRSGGRESAPSKTRRNQSHLTLAATVQGGGRSRPFADRGIAPRLSPLSQWRRGGGCGFTALGSSAANVERFSLPLGPQID